MGQHRSTWTERGRRGRSAGRHRRTPSGHRRTSVATAVLLLAGLATLPAVPALAQTEDSFVIGYGDTVSDGVPGPGAGNLEVGGATDSYSFDATAGDVAVFDVLVGGSTTFRWRLEAPDGSELFDGFYLDLQAALPDTGTYTLTVRGAGPTTTGTYSFQLLLAPLPQQFTIAFGDTVSDGVPAPGAGNLEGPGAVDHYQFDATAGQVAIFGALTGDNSQIRWRLDAPDGTELFDSIYTDQQVALDQTGTHTLTVYGRTPTRSGTYSFTLLETPAPQQFTIAFGDTVSDGVPAPGAGNLEGPGAVDHYQFDATAGQIAIFGALTGDNSQIRWRLDAPDGTELFDSIYTDQQVALDQTGTHTLTVYGRTPTRSGTYSFTLLETPAPQQFTIAFGDTVSDGVPAPGAGNLEGPGAVDHYQFDATAGQVAILDALTGSNTLIRWRLDAPDGTEVLDTIYSDRQVTLDQTGTHTLTVFGITPTSFDVYSFQLLAAPPQIDEFTIAFGDTVSDGVPGPGAGNLEGPGAVDRYHFDATAGQVAILDALTGSNTLIRWRLDAPDGTEVLDTIYSDRQVTLDQTGTYTLTVFGVTPTSFGVYSFTLLEVPANEPPVAVADEAETDHDTPVSIDVLANDTDPDGDTLTVDAVTTPANGTATHTSDQVTYTPNTGFTGTDTFTYTITDGNGGFAQATVTVTVHEPPNNPPTVADIDDQTNTVGDTVDLQVQATDPDGDPLTHTATGLPDDLTIDPTTGPISGTIADGADTNSPYTVQVTVTDPDGATATGFTWTVEPAGSEVVSVDIEIVPPVIINDGHGVIPVLILGNADVAGNQIDPATVRLEGMPVARLLGLWLAVRCDVNHDGVADLLVLIDDVAGAIPPGATTATLTGETFGGTRFAGTDDIILLWW